MVAVALPPEVHQQYLRVLALCIPEGVDDTIFRNDGICRSNPPSMGNTVEDATSDGIDEVPVRVWEGGRGGGQMQIQSYCKPYE